MHLILGEACGNSAAAVKLYAERYPQRRLPNICTSHAVGRRITRTDAVHPTTVKRGELRSARTADVGDRRVRRGEENARACVHRIQAAENGARTTVPRVRSCCTLIIHEEYKLLDSSIFAHAKYLASCSFDNAVKILSSAALYSIIWASTVTLTTIVTSCHWNVKLHF
jgi:hypothetical protein